MSTNKRTRAASESLVFLLIGAGILLALNVLGLFTPYGRFDATRNHLFSLAPSSERLMNELNEDMEIVAYFSQDLPPQFASTEREVRDLLEEYVQASNGHLTVRVINPDTDELKAQAEEDGVEAVQHQLIEAGARSSRLGFRGLVIKYLGETRPIPVIAGTDGLEYELTMRIKQLVGEQRVIGIMSGHGASSLSTDLGPLRQLLPNYELREVSAAEPIPADVVAMLVVAPNEAIPEAELQNLNAFVMNGGGLGIIGGSVKLNLEQQQGPPSAELVDTGLNTLLERWGVRLEQNLVADPQCELLPMGGMAVPYPFFPRAVLDAEQQEHPSAFGLATVTMPFSASVSVLDESPADVRILPVISSSEGAWVVNDSNIAIMPRDPTEWHRTGRVGTRGMAVAIQGPLPSAFPDAGGDTPARAASDVRVLVVGSSALFLQAGQGQMTDTLVFALNSVDWLAAEEDLIAIRTKSVAEPGLDQPASLRAAEQRAQTARENEDRDEFAAALEERQAAEDAYKRSQQVTQWALTLGLPLLLALFGVIRWRQRIAKKNNIKL
ncbi:MAG: GldG family protein [Polyangiales bacterium]|nr:GldG family protein [Myxococcales bacterium]MCB9656344.1 GldG family protein [Sandaracinaceae bacterium]